MKNEKYRCSMTPFICSIVPIGVVGLIWLVTFAFPGIFRLEGGCFLGTWDLFPCCIVPLIALVMMPMGIYSVISGMAEIRVFEAKGKTLVVVAIVLGILDIAAGAGFLLYLFRIFSKVF
ncbi:MAG: hypothetical protein ACYS6K_18755 [Planctomycetota bacterium]